LGSRVKPNELFYRRGGWGPRVVGKGENRGGKKGMFQLVLERRPYEPRRLSMAQMSKPLLTMKERRGISDQQGKNPKARGE